jgi:hypothetical protein
MTARLHVATAVALSALAACSGTSGRAASGPRPASVAAAPNKPFEYAASTGQYRFTSSTKMLQSMMGQSQEITTSNNRLVTLALTRTAPDTVTMTMTIDSVSATGPMGMPVMGIDKLPGVKIIAKLAPNGSFYSVTGPSEAENAPAAAMTDEAGRALPRLKATLTLGATWTDTIKDRVRQGPVYLDREVATKFTVSGDTVVGGVPAWKISREQTLKGSGKGTANGQEASLETTGTAASVLIMSKAGVLLSGSGEEKLVGTVTMSMGQVNLNGTTTSSVTKIK